MNVPAEILEQLGGRKFIAMTGAKCYADNFEKTLICKFPGSKVANVLYITLTSMDVYTMRFAKFRGMTAKDVVIYENVYNDQLKQLFTAVTGLYVSL